jgi:hypothetical protein
MVVSARRGDGEQGVLSSAACVTAGGLAAVDQQQWIMDL